MVDVYTYHSASGHFQAFSSLIRLSDTDRLHRSFGDWVC